MDRLLIKETRFFRHPPSFNYVANILTGGLDVPGSDSQSEPPSGFSLWSVGCASGEEAYSLAILSEQLCQAGKLSSPFRLLATDVSQSALDIARRGEYPRSRLRHLNAMQHAWFESAGDKFLRVRATLKSALFSPGIICSIRYQAKPSMSFSVRTCWYMSHRHAEKCYWRNWRVPSNRLVV